MKFIISTFFNKIYGPPMIAHISSLTLSTNKKIGFQFPPMRVQYWLEGRVVA